MPTTVEFIDGELARFYCLDSGDLLQHYKNKEFQTNSDIDSLCYCFVTILNEI